METYIIRGKLKQLGMTIMEALVAAVIVGIGFIAVMQMIQYSMRSADVSSERTKVNYLTDMLSEDLIAYKDTQKGSEKMVDYMRSDTNWLEISTCEDTTISDPNNNNAYDNREEFWKSRLSKEFLKCNDNSEKKLSVIKICNPSAKNCESSDISRSTEFEGIYIGVAEIKVPGRAAPHILYFQAK
tara:strand:- start:160 stop:714 length:555 start_codon:yes stop_codon:yes gene_type:complete